tara:strand:- start:630 stop:878 length:249 start_codon:yes stop_codon:yes gene_type:complete
MEDILHEYNTKSCISMMIQVSTEEAFAVQQAMLMAETVYAKNHDTWNDEEKEFQHHIINELKSLLAKLNNTFSGTKSIVYND